MILSRALLGAYRLFLTEDDKKTAADLKNKFMFFGDQFQNQVTVQIFMDVKRIQDQLSEQTASRSWIPLTLPRIHGGQKALK